MSAEVLAQSHLLAEMLELRTPESASTLGIEEVKEVAFADPSAAFL